MENISRTIRTTWKRSLISAVPVAAGLIALTTMAHAQFRQCVFSIELSPREIVFNECLLVAQFIAVLILAFSFIGMQSDKRRVFRTAVVGMAFSGVVFLASAFFKDAIYRAVDGILS
jgi:hypothetical protein